MTRSKTSSYSPKLIRKEEKQLSKQAVKEGRIDRETITAQSFRYRRELVQNSINLTTTDYINPEDVVEDKPKRPRQSASSRQTLVQTKNILGAMCSSQVNSAVGMVLDETEVHYDEESDGDDIVDNRRRPTPTIEIALLDIATPAKPKGIAKEFEVVPGPRSVIVLEDETYTDMEEEWEKLYEERAPHATYSAVLQGVGG